MSAQAVSCVGIISDTHGYLNKIDEILAATAD